MTTTERERGVIDFDEARLVADAKADECLEKFLVEFRRNGGGIVTPSEKLMILEAYKFGFLDGIQYCATAMLKAL